MLQKFLSRLRASLLETFFRDASYAIRQFRKSPSFTAAAVLTLALGIGAATSVFSIFDAVLLRPLPYAHSDRLIEIWQSDPKHLATTGVWNTWRDYKAWKEDLHAIEDLAAYTWVTPDSVVRGRGRPYSVLALPVTPNFFSVLGVRAILGRTFQPDDKPGTPLIVVSYGFWKAHLGGDQHIVGEKLALNETTYTVIGIMPPGFQFYPKELGLWRLMRANEPFIQDPDQGVLVIFGHTQPGRTLSAVQAELTAIHTNEPRSHRDAARSKYIPLVRNLRYDVTWLTGCNLRITLILLLAAVGILLLIACMNVANLLMTRGIERQRELAIRAALGSGQWRLLRQLLAEGLLLSCFGTLFGVFLAFAALHYFRVANPIDLPPGNPIALNLRVLIFSIGLTLVATVLSSLLPAWSLSSIDLNQALKEATRGFSFSLRRSSKTKLLVSAEVAFSLVLLVASGLLIHSVERVATEPLGFQPSQLLSLEIQLPRKDYSTPVQQRQFYDRLLSRVRSLPGTVDAALGTLDLLRGDNNEIVQVEGRPAPPPDAEMGDAGSLSISLTYFRTLRTPLLAGREFDVQDSEHAEKVAIVSQSFAERYFPRQVPLGKHIRIGYPLNQKPWLTIVGVVGNMKRGSVFQEMGWVDGLDVYRPFAQSSSLKAQLTIRFRTSGTDLAKTIPQEVALLDPNLPVGAITPVNQTINQSMAYPRFRALLLSLFAAIALVLATTGIYGVVSQTITSRAYEIGIRMALGATRGDVLRLVSKESIGLLLLGLGAGILLTLTLNRFLVHLLYEIEPYDPLALLGVVVILAASALAAIAIPARRATKIEPMIALRCE